MAEPQGATAAMEGREQHAAGITEMPEEAADPAEGGKPTEAAGEAATGDH